MVFLIPSIPIKACFEKYIGLLTFICLDKNIAFNLLKERFWKKINGWKEKLLYQAIEKISIKEIGQVIPFYAMSIFKFPKIFCDELTKLLIDFWWSSENKKGFIGIKFACQKLWEV